MGVSMSCGLKKGTFKDGVLLASLNQIKSKRGPRRGSARVSLRKTDLESGAGINVPRLLHQGELKALRPGGADMSRWLKTRAPGVSFR